MGIIRPGLSLTLYKSATLHSLLWLFSSSVPSSPLNPAFLFVYSCSFDSSRKSLPKPDKSNFADPSQPQQPAAKKLWPQVVQHIPPSSASFPPPQTWPTEFEPLLDSGGCRLPRLDCSPLCAAAHSSFCRSCCQKPGYFCSHSVLLPIKNDFFSKNVLNFTQGTHPCVIPTTPSFPWEQIAN